MTVDDLNDLAGRVEGLARVVFHLVARLEDSGVIDGPDFAEGLRKSIVLKDDASVLMVSAKRTLDHAANTLNEARRWRKFRREIDMPAKPKRKAA